MDLPGSFDLNLLRALSALLQERNVTRAADICCVSQPAMSGALERLRSYFGDPLLVRVGRTMQLSPLAESLREPVSALLAQISDVLEVRPSFDPRTARRDFDIAISDYATLVLMPEVLRRLASLGPNISCRVRNIEASTYADLENGKIDLVLAADDFRIYADFQPTAETQIQALFGDDFVCMVDRDHPDIGDSITLEQYRTLPHNRLALGRGIISLVERAWRVANLDIHVAASSQTFSSLILMLPGTRLICTAQRRLCRVFAQALPLKILECPIHIEPLKEVMVWHARQEHEPGHALLRKIVSDAALSLNRTR